MADAPDNEHPSGVSRRFAVVFPRIAPDEPAPLLRLGSTARRLLRSDPRRASIALATLLALAAAFTGVAAGPQWLGFAAIAVALNEGERWLVRQQDLPWPNVVRSLVRLTLAAIACIAAGVAFPPYWWVPMALTLAVLHTALSSSGRVVVLVTVPASVVSLAVSWAVGGPGGEPGPTEVGLAVTVALPVAAWLVHARSARSRSERAELQRVMRDLRVASAEMQRSQEALRRWNEDLRSEVDRQTGALEERNRYLSIINAVSFALAEPMDDERALERAVRLVARLLGVRAAQAYTEPRPGHPIALFVTVAAEDVHAPRVPESLLRVVSTTGRPVSSFGGVQPSVAAEESRCASQASAQMLGHLPDLGEPYHVVPLVAKGRVLGSFALVGAGSLRNDDDGRHLLLLVGREMGIAIENARLYQEAIEKAEREAFLTEVSRLLNGPGRGDRALPAVLEALRIQTAADEVMLVTLPEDSRDVIVAGTALRMGAPSRLDALARSLPRQVVDRNRPLVLGVGGEAPVSDRLTAIGVTTLAVAPIYLQRSEISEETSAGSAPGANSGSGRTGTVLTGALAVLVGSEGEWSEDEVALLERVGDILARRVQADEFVAVQQQRIRELTGLAEVARLMQSGADEDRLYHGFASSLRRLMRYESLHIARVDESMRLTEVPSFGQSGRPMGVPLSPDDVAHPWFALRSPALWIRGDAPPPAFLPDDSRYAIVVPMRPKGQMIGLAVVSVPRPLRGGQIPIVEQAVEQLSLALDGATLYQQATARASHIQALSNLARIVASVVNLREAFAAFSEEVRWLIPFDRAVMFLVDDDAAAVEPYAIYPDGGLTSGAVDLDGSVVQIAVEAGSAVAIRREDPRAAALDWQVLGEGATEAAAVPIRHGGRTSAVFVVVTNAEAGYDIGDLDALDEVAGLLAVTIDRLRLFEQADHSAKHDLLTELPNYRYLQERLAALQAPAVDDDAVASTADAPSGGAGALDDRWGADSEPVEVGEASRVALLVIDMDNLKVFNDTLGHEVGDRVIREVGRVLRSSCRTQDFVARTGGDEFVIVMEGSDAGGALIVADQIHAAVQEIHVEMDGIDTRVGVSIGVAVWPGDAETPAGLLHLADQAMYDAKFAGGQRTRLASDRTGSPEPRAVRGRNVRLADTLIRALVTGGSLEELAAISLAQRWASAVVGRANLPAELLTQIRLVIAAGASRRFAEPRGDRDQMLARYLVDRIEEDWEQLVEEHLGEQLTFLAWALLDLAWMVVLQPSGGTVSIEVALDRVAEAYPHAADFPVWLALQGVARQGADRRRAA